MQVRRHLPAHASKAVVGSDAHARAADGVRGAVLVLGVASFLDLSGTTIISGEHVRDLCHVLLPGLLRRVRARGLQPRGPRRLIGEL